MDIFNRWRMVWVFECKDPWVKVTDIYVMYNTLVKNQDQSAISFWFLFSLNSGSKVQEPFLGFFEKRRQSVHFKVEDFRAVDIVAHSIRVSFERATEIKESGCISKLGHLLLLHISGQSIFYCISRLMGSVLSDFCLCACWDDSDWFLCKGMQPNTESKHVIWWQMAQQLQLQL